MKNFINKKKVKNWLKRYLPAEILCTATAMIGALTVHYYTKNDILTALAGTWGENLGFYAVHIGRDIHDKKEQEKSAGKSYTFISLFHNIKNTLLEFGPAEIIDSFLSRPFMMYFFPKITGNLHTGIFLGKIAADIIIYIPIIATYETRKFIRDKTKT